MRTQYFTVETYFLWINVVVAFNWRAGRDRIVVSTLRCGRNNPGSNPGHGRAVDSSVTAGPVRFHKTEGYF